MKIDTNKEKIEELLTRGVEHIYPSREELEKKLLSGERIKLYCGYDPSATALHIGNAISINKMARFQELGHEVIFLVGDFTGMIGDPTDKNASRKKMTRSEVLANSKNYKKQAGSYLNFSGKNPAKVLYNSKWSDKMTFKDLIELTSHFTVQQMIERDMFQERLKDGKPIYLHEFLYPLAQGYDSVAMDVDLELGGNDQMFNMMVGRSLMRELKNKEKFVLTLKLLADETGKKMGKTEGNVVFLDEGPGEMYGKVMSWVDGILPSAFELCTNLPYAEVKQITHDLKDEKVNPRDMKMRLAYEITKINHGDKKAKEAQDNFINTFQKKTIPTDIPEIKAGVGEALIDVLTVNKIVESKSDFRRLVNEGAITDLDTEEVIKDAYLKISKPLTLKIGKKRFVKIIL